MKKNQEITEIAVLVFQMLILFLIWQQGYMAFDNSEFYAALSILIIGICGGLLSNLKTINKLTINPIIEKTIFFILITISTFGMYFVFFPLIAILMHSGTTAIIFLSGVISPWLIPIILNRRLEN